MNCFCEDISGAGLFSRSRDRKNNFICDTSVNVINETKISSNQLKSGRNFQ